MDGRMDRQKDGQMNGRTELAKTIYPFGLLRMPGV